MTIRRDRKFIEAIIEYGNFSKAAKNLYVTQPYLSKTIKNIEKEINAIILERDNYPLKLTVAGQIYLKYLKNVEEQQRLMKQEILKSLAITTGKLTIGVSPLLSSYILYNILPNFMRTYPDISIDIQEHPVRKIERGLKDNEIDLAIQILPIQDSEIQYEILYGESIYLVIPFGHNLYNVYERDDEKFIEAMKSTEKLKFILLKNQTSMRQSTDRILNYFNIKPDILMETTNIENAYRLVNEGIALTFVPEIVKNNYMNDKNRYIKMPKQFNNQIVIAKHRKREMSEAVELFLNMLNIQF